MTVISPLTWKRDGADWILLDGCRRFGRVVADAKYPGMWRSSMPGGGLSDMANLAWAKNAVLVAAERELEYEARTANAPSKCPVNEGVFEPSASQTRFGEVGATSGLSAATRTSRKAA
jgi:hypothetical protein